MYGKNNLKIIMRKICKEYFIKKNVYVYKIKFYDLGVFCVVIIVFIWFDGWYV